MAAVEQTVLKQLEALLAQVRESEAARERAERRAEVLSAGVKKCGLRDSMPYSENDAFLDALYGDQEVCQKPSQDVVGEWALAFTERRVEEKEKAEAARREELLREHQRTRSVEDKWYEFAKEYIVREYFSGTGWVVQIPQYGTTYPCDSDASAQLRAAGGAELVATKVAARLRLAGFQCDVVNNGPYTNIRVRNVRSAAIWGTFPHATPALASDDESDVE